MPAEDSNEFFGHLNQPATPRKQRRPSSSSLERPATGDFKQVPDPFGDVVAGDHPLNSSGQSAGHLPERGRARTRMTKGPGLSPGIPKLHEKPPTRDIPRSGVVLTPGGVKRVEDDPPAADEVIQVESVAEGPPATFHEQSRSKNDKDDVNWEEYAADGFPALAAEEFGVKAKRTDTGRVVPVAVRADLTEDALKGRSIKSRDKATRRALKAEKKRTAPKSIWGKIGDSLRLTRPAEVDEDEPASTAKKATGKGFARSGSMPAKKRAKKTPLGMAWNVFVEVAKILMLVLLLRAYVVQVSQVQGPSMQGTLEERDRLVVERITPLIANNTDKWWISWLPDFLTPELKRGDIVVIRSPEDPGLELVKRLIALPGDTIKFEDGKLLLKPVGGAKFEQVKEDYITSETLKNTDGTFRSYSLGDLGSHVSEGDEVVIPSQRVFVMGDNRTQSNDSRRWLEIDVRRTEPPGVDRLWVHTTSVEGRVIFRIWPFERMWPPVK